MKMLYYKISLEMQHLIKQYVILKLLGQAVITIQLIINDL